jgi:hypothetical protein
METGELHKILMDSLENFQKSVTLSINEMLKNIKDLQETDALTSETLEPIIAPARGLFQARLLSAFLRLTLDSEKTDATKEAMSYLWQLSEQLYKESLVAAAPVNPSSASLSVEDTIAQFHKTLAQKEQLIAQKIKENQDRIAAIQNKINATQV